MLDATSAAAPVLSPPRQIATLQLGLEMAQTSQSQTYTMRGLWPKGEDTLPRGGGTSQAIIIVKPPRMSLDDE